MILTPLNKDKAKATAGNKQNNFPHFYSLQLPLWDNSFLLLNKMESFPEQPSKTNAIC